MATTVNKRSCTVSVYTQHGSDPIVFSGAQGNKVLQQLLKKESVNAVPDAKGAPQVIIPFWSIEYAAVECDTTEADMTDSACVTA